jgi:DNA topoisomerase-2
MNDGAGIPVEMHSEEKVYVPELIFGHLLTSSNYNDAEKKVTGGRNGFGAKLANVFSKEFVVETCDGHRQKRYRQVRVSYSQYEHTGGGGGGCSCAADR